MKTRPQVGKWESGKVGVLDPSPQPSPLGGARGIVRRLLTCPLSHFLTFGLLLLAFGPKEARAQGYTVHQINVGSTNNDKTGDSMRAAFQKVNSNFVAVVTNSVSVQGLTSTSNDLRTTTIVGLTNKVEVKPSFRRFFPIGDSLTAEPIPTGWWYMLTNELVTISVSTTNTATGGWALVDLENDYVTHVLPSNPTTNDLVSVWIGANEYGNTVPTNWIARHTAYCNTLTSNGATLAVFTIMPRAPVYSDKRGETNRAVLNNYLRSFTNAYVVDVARRFDNPSNSVVFRSDGTHLTAYGNRGVAGMFKDALAAPKTMEGAVLVTQFSNTVMVV